jgi:ribosomal protein S18 acetylase RimI-like enzyme
MSYTRLGESGYYIYDEGGHMNFTCELVSNDEIDVLIYKLYKVHNDDFWARYHHGGRIIENYEKRKISLKRHDRFMDDTEAESAVISALAGEIWREHYTPIIGAEQVEYMLAKFQSPEQICKDINENKYIYFTAKCEKDYNAPHFSELATQINAGQPFEISDFFNEAGSDNQHEIIGYAAVVPKDEYLLLSKIYVKTNHRGRGVARAFLNEAIALCHLEYNFNKIRLTVNKNNEVAIKAYHKMSFETIDSVKTDIGGGFFMDDYVMELAVEWPEAKE